MKNGSQNYVSLLNEYAQKNGTTVNYTEVATSGPDHIRTFTIRAEVHNKAYPVGVGKTKKEARQSAAKNALNGIRGNERTECDVVSTPAQNVPQSPSEFPATITQPNYLCWLNEYSHKCRLRVEFTESLRMSQGASIQCCKCVLGGKEYQEAFGKTRKEAREAAAQLVYETLVQEHSVKVAENVEANCSGEATSQRQGSSTNDTFLREKLGQLNFSSATPDQRNMPTTNYIGLLNHYCQKMTLVCDFKQLERTGPSHDPSFEYQVIIGTKEYSEGLGKTVKEAKQRAAQYAWTELQEQSDWNSQVSLKSDVSEEETTSLTSSVSDAADTTSSSQGVAESSSSSVIFRNSSSSSLEKPVIQNVSPVNTKPKRKLAVNFQYLQKIEQGHVSDVDSLPTGEKPISQMGKSRFITEFSAIKPIGKGGFGRVFMAKRELERRVFAVKIVRSTEKAQREVGALADLQHPNIIRYYTCWIEDTAYRCETSDSFSSSNSGSNTETKYLYIQMEFCVGNNLRVWIDEMNMSRKPKPGRRLQALHITQHILEAVKYIHSKRLIHRDLKPANIMFGQDGEVKVGDFGLVTAYESDQDSQLLERTKSTGTRSYMSPEQKAHLSYDRKVDIFALGLIYFELLWNLSGMEKQKIWSDVRNNLFPSNFPERCCFEHKLIERMLSECPEDRPDASKLILDLKKGSSVLITQSPQVNENRTF